MKRILLLLLAVMVGNMVGAQMTKPTAEQRKALFEQYKKREMKERHKEGIPLGSSYQAPKQSNSQKSLPGDRVWFPGEWEEVQAIVVTPVYDYYPATNLGSGTWSADPLVTGYADYLKWTNGHWQRTGQSGPYVAEMDTTSAMGKVFFYLMDGIQLGGAEAWVRIEQGSDSNIVKRTLGRMHLRSDNLKFIIGPGNLFWYRDCGPICFYYGQEDSVAMLDFTYYPGRALDDSLPSLIEAQKGIPNFPTNIEWEGGNCLVDGAGMVLSSDAIYESNSDHYGQLIWNGYDINTLTYNYVPILSQAQVRQGLHDLLGQRATYILPAYQFDGGTGHVDLYVDAYDENGFVFSIMPDNYSSWVDYTTGAKNIDSLCSYSSIHDRDYYTMGTLPFPSKDNGSNFSSQTEYDYNYTRTYSNHTFVNNVILQPCFSNVVDGEPSAQWDRENLELVKAAYPGYTIYPVNVKSFDGSGGAIHCVTKQIPAENPIRILHKTLHGTVGTGNLTEIPVSAIITNKSGIEHAELVYREGDGEWQTVTLNANDNRFNGTIPVIADDQEHEIEYYISATSNNGKTMTKPITANQGGYFSFTYSSQASYNAEDYDFNTEAMPAENITFTFGYDWIGIDEVETSDQNFGQFYPNPASDQANIKIDLQDGQNYTVTIVDQSGRTVHTTSLQAAGEVLFTIQTSRLAAGSYVVLFANKGNQVARKLIVNR
ncbi:MAG: agmatine deiminase family protein [Bacteroidales bacterium]|nr:agmatine deiminase family protein [Bacteroidales bacterium]